MNVLKLLFPEKCLVCGRVLEGDRPVCAECWDKLVFIGEGERAVFLDGAVRCISLLEYRPPADGLVIAMKRRSRRAAARFFARMLARAMRERGQDGWTLVTAVPASARRVREQGRDHAAILAEAVAAELGTPCREDLLVRRGGQSQHLLDAAAREVNAKESYEAGGVSLAGERVLLVDDVVTTGATLRRCARLLLEQGAQEVACATLARTIGRRG